MTEACAWLRRGHPLEVLTHAIPWAVEPTDGDLAAYKRARSFPTLCGALPTRVSVMLVARFDGPCPNLGGDMRCGIYADRPLVCRIYPAEINPHVGFDTARKNCPPEAWAADAPPLLREDGPVDAALRAQIEAARAQGQSDTPWQAALCRLLGIQAAALANEGYLVFHTAPATLLAAIEEAAAAQPGDDAPPPAWTLVTNRRSSAQTLLSVGADVALVPAGGDGPARYMGFFPDEP